MYLQKGFSLIEVMVSMVVMTVIVAGVSAVSAVGRTSWSETETNIRLQENLRQTVHKMSSELRQSKASQVTITEGGGMGTTDSVTFSVPITCESGTSVIDANGDVPYWGAPLTWGCSDSSCMDADNDCSVLEYKFVEYVVSNNQLLRRVLNSAGGMVTDVTFANNITDYQVSRVGNLVTVNISTEEVSPLQRTLTAQVSTDILLRN